MIHWESFAHTAAEPGNYWHDTIIQDLVARIPEEVNLLITPGHFRDAVGINKWLNKHGPAIVWILGDEEGDCPFWEVQAPVWRQFPNPHRAYWPDRILPLGYTPHTRPAVQSLGLPLDKKGWVFAGQNTNKRRRACVDALNRIDPARVHASPTFAGGLEREAYIEALWESEWAPCPAGNERADSFRMWEALEAGTVPILDATSPAGDRNVWPDTLGDHPFPMVEDWETVGKILENPAPLTEAAVWYLRYKRDLVARLVDDWYELIGEDPWPDPVDRITSIITASPLPSHPDFQILETTIESVRTALPGNEIIVAFDGPRDSDDREEYEEHIRRVAWWANQYAPEVWIWYSGEWKHQAGTLKDVLPHVRSGVVLVLEADTPLVGEVQFHRIVELLYQGEFNHVRLHYDASIHPEHIYLMRGLYKEKGWGAIMRTVQYSQRPHLALTAWYSEFLSQIPVGARTYVEDCVYGEVAKSEWGEFKLGIYHPEGDVKRSTHLDGRGGVEKGPFWW